MSWVVLGRTQVDAEQFVNMDPVNPQFSIYEYLPWHVCVSLGSGKPSCFMLETTAE